MSNRDKALEEYCALPTPRDESAQEWPKRYWHGFRKHGTDYWAEGDQYGGTEYLSKAESDFLAEKARLAGHSDIAHYIVATLTRAGHEDLAGVIMALCPEYWKGKALARPARVEEKES